MAFAVLLSGQDPCADIWSDECTALRRANPNCFDDNLTNRCAEAEQARVRALLGVPPIEDEAAAGVEVYRAFFVDGYGRDMPAVSFERRPNEAPKVVIYGVEGHRLSEPVAMETWETVSRRSLFAEAPPPHDTNRPVSTLGPGSPGNPGDEIEEVVICLHSWVATFESTMARDGTPMIRRRTEDSCQGGFTTAYAFEVAALAVSSLLACERLRPDDHRNDVARLQACLTLEGDTIAAGDLMNEKDDLPSPYWQRPVTAEAWRDWLGAGHAARIDWAGEVLVEPQGYYDTRPARPDLPQFLVQRATALAPFILRPARYVGENANRARIVGEISYPIGDPGASRSYMAADYSQVWIRSAGDAWRLDSWTVGAFNRHDVPED